MTLPSVPVVAVTTDEIFHRIYDWHAAPVQYLEAAFEASGVIPLLVPSLGKGMDPATILSRVDGLLVTGAKSNVHPEHYDTEPEISHEPFDPARDSTSLPLIRKAIELGVPVLAICRGIQELNVALGGSLDTEIQELEGIQDHRGAESTDNDERFKIAHPVKFAEGSCLAEIFGTAEIDVNSVHRQAIDRLGNGLVVEAQAQDGTVEAVSAPDAPGFVVGVQWHPEYWFRTDAASARIFEAFGDAVREYVTKRDGLSVAAE